MLASGSVTRKHLLGAAGLPFVARSPDIDERAIEASLTGASPAELALALARAKALAVSADAPEALCLGADQVLSLGDRIFHKSATREEALRTLSALSGATHRLTSAFALTRGGQLVAEGAEAADLTLRKLDDARLRLYLDAAGESALGSVGVYHWEGFGVHLFARVIGDHSTILGLPMLKLLAALREIGALKL
jgi:septum formation protein